MLHYCSFYLSSIQRFQYIKLNMPCQCLDIFSNCMYSSTTIRLNILVDFILYLYKPMLLVLQQSEKGKILPIAIPSGICLDLYPCHFISLLYGMKNLMKINSFINPKQDIHFSIMLYPLDYQLIKAICSLYNCFIDSHYTFTILCTYCIPMTILQFLSIHIT